MYMKFTNDSIWTIAVQGKFYRIPNLSSQDPIELGKKKI